MTTLDTISYIDWSAKILNEHLKTEPKWLATCSKVNRYTRAGKDGKFIICPECHQGQFVFHLGYYSSIYFHTSFHSDPLGVL